eukprot:2179011-Alexandrium_andersonii.AAC.1
MAQGVPLASVPQDAATRIAPLMLIPVVERVIESRHALIKKGLRGRKVVRSPARVSLSAGRLHEFQSRVQDNPSVFLEVARHLESVRNSRSAATVFQ